MRSTLNHNGVNVKYFISFNFDSGRVGNAVHNVSKKIKTREDITAIENEILNEIKEDDPSVEKVVLTSYKKMG